VSDAAGSGVLDCFHCGLPVPKGLDIEAFVLGAPRAMCCHGCAAVARTLEEQGLADYYRHRTEIPMTPAELPAALDRELERVEAAGLADELSPLDEEGLRTASLLVEDMRCAACAWLIEERLRPLPGMARATVNLGTQAVHVAFDPDQGSLGQVVRALHDVGYHARPRRPDTLAEHRQREHRRALLRLGVSGMGAMNVMTYAAALYAGAFVGMEDRYETLFRWVSFVVTTPVLFVAGEPFFTAAWRDLRARRPGMDVPIALAMGSAYFASAWATWTGTGEIYFDSVCMFAFFLTLGRSIEMWVRHRAGDATDRLLRAEPETACRLEAGREAWVPAAAIERGDHVLVRPGAAIPCDGRIVEGSTSVGEALLTGEPWPRDVGPGGRVFGGSTNVDQPIVVEATRGGRESMLASIVALLERAQSETPPVVLRADKVARWFVTGVLAIATITALAWLRIAPDRAFEVTLAVLVATCPCALSLATPVALAAAQSALAKAGVLVTRGHVVESLAEIGHVLLDKTGTLTRGEPTLACTQREREGDSRDLLALAARLEEGSEHPVAGALLRAFARSGSPAFDTPVDERRAVHGAGIEALISGERIRVGRPDWVAELVPPDRNAGAPVPDDAHVWVSLGDAKGRLALFGPKDPLRTETPDAMTALHALGLELEMVTGDPSPAAASLAHELGLDGVTTGASPEAKRERVRALQQAGERVAAVGDGVNDAPLLGQAEVSIAMGGGTDLAKTGADAVLMHDRLSLVPQAIAHARTTRRLIRQNLAWAVAYNAAVLPLAVLGQLAPWQSALGMSLSSLLVVVNGVRATRMKGVA